MKNKILVGLLLVLTLVTIVSAAHQTNFYTVAFQAKDTLSLLEQPTRVIYSCILATSANNAVSTGLTTFNGQFGHFHQLVQVSAAKNSIGC